MTSNGQSAEENKLLRPVIRAEAVTSFSGMDEIIVALDERRGTLPIRNVTQC